MHPRSPGRRNISAKIAEKSVSSGDSAVAHSYGYELVSITKRSSPFDNSDSKVSTAQTPRAKKIGSHARSCGFTLIELLVTISVLVLLMMVALPSYEAATTSGRLSATSSTLVNHMKLARSEAIKRNATVSLCVSTTGTSCTAGSWNQGWIVIASGAVIARQEPLTANLRVSEAGSNNNLSFDATGLLATAASFNLCNTSAVVQQRNVQASAGGRVKSARMNATSCS